jgi:rare lipoprotein A
VSSTEGLATWYEVPNGSRAERRAPGELTGAYDRLPLGAYVRVTNKANGSAVVVRITDGGVGTRRGIDLCKEAAEQIGLVGKGEAKVLIEELRARNNANESK